MDWTSTLRGFLTVYMGLLGLSYGSPVEGVGRKCVKLSITQCVNMGTYTHALFPNILGHIGQAQAQKALNTFQVFLKDLKCGPHLQPFLCHLAAPPCDLQTSKKMPPGMLTPVKPCHKSCMKAKSRCRHVMKRHGVTWPADFQCSQFERGTQCLHANYTAIGKHQAQHGNTTVSSISKSHGTHKDLKNHKDKHNKHTTVKHKKDHIKQKSKSITKHKESQLPVSSKRQHSKVKKHKNMKKVLNNHTVDEDHPNHTKKNHTHAKKMPAKEKHIHPVKKHHKSIAKSKAAKKTVKKHIKEKLSRKSSGKHVTKAASNKSSGSHPGVLARRYDLTDLGDSHMFHGWVDVQAQGAANDYCRVIGKNTSTRFLSCALAGSTESYHTYVSARGFDVGHKDTWFMRDMDGDGRDDYCRCVGHGAKSRISCMKAGRHGFAGSSIQSGNQHSFTVKGSSPCEGKVINPALGLGQE